MRRLFTAGISRPRKLIAVTVGLALVAGVAGIAQSATSTVAPADASGLVRDNVITITTNPVARMFSRTPTTSNPNPNWSATNPFTAGNGTSPPTTSSTNAACQGDNGPIGSSSGAATNLPRNNSPRSEVIVTGPAPSTAVVFDSLSPAIDTSLAGAFTPAAQGGPFPERNPQPAGPNDTNYRGGVTPSGQTALTRPWVAKVNMTGKQAGTYTVKTITRNMTKQGSTGLCTIATAVPGTNAAAVTGPKTETLTFNFRPWQYVFTDVLGNGNIKMNLTPREFQPNVANQPGAIYPGNDQNMLQFALKTPVTYGGNSQFMLPPDPAACGSNPSSCLPANVTPCEPGTDCVTRFVVIKRSLPIGDTVEGVFDLQTMAFIAKVDVNGHRRVLFSLGTTNDAVYKELLTTLAAQAAAHGVDLLSILATKVRVRTGTVEIALSLLNGLQIDASTAPRGVQIVSDFTVQAGLILDIYARLGGTCTATAGDSNPATPAPDRYQHTADVGYTVQKSDLLPDVPRVGVLGALVGGPIYHIKGDFGGSTPALVNTATAVIGLDTAADEPNGYPIWVEPFLSAPAHVAAPRTMDFIGTATWSATETPVTGVGCLTIDFMLGAGIALYNNPLDLGFGDIPIWDPQNPAVVGVMQQINVAVQGLVDQVATNPQVAALIQQISDAVLGGGLPTNGLPLGAPAASGPLTSLPSVTNVTNLVGNLTR